MKAEMLKDKHAEEVKGTIEEGRVPDNNEEGVKSEEGRSNVELFNILRKTFTNIT